MEKPKKKCPVIVLCVLFAAWFLVIPFGLGVVLYIRNIMIDKENKEHLQKLSDEQKLLEENIASSKAEHEKIIADKDALLAHYQQEALDRVDNECKQKLADAENKAQARAQEVEDSLSDKTDKLKHIEQDMSVKQLMLDEISAEYEKSLKTIESNANKVVKLKEIYKSFQHAIKAYEQGSDSYLDEALVSMAEQTLEPIIETKLNCMNVKQLKARYNQEQKNIQETFKRYEGRYTTKANAAIYKLMVIALEAELQNVLYSLKFSNLTESVEAIKNITARYLSIAVDGNQSIAPTMKKFIGEIEYLFIEAVQIEYEYYKQRERIKEEQRAIKEQMRQEAEERRALEVEKKKIEKEELKYSAELDTVNEQMRSCTDSEQLKKYEQRIKELQDQLNKVAEKKDDIVKLQNGKAGHVYIISNIGSFGDDVYKIGMTRRSEPLDRVKELGDASVPFSFDVHSMIFSDDAVALENALHKELSDRRVNKINLRKEFFRISLDELEELVYKHQPTAEFNRTALATEYRQGLTMDGETFELSDEDFDE